MAEKPRSAGPVVVGVISDTHGRLDAQMTEKMEGVDHIIHAGDIGSSQVLAALRNIAPLTAVRGNCDLDSWASTLPTSTELTIGGVRILVGHFAGRLRDALAQDRREQADREAGVGADSERPGIRVVVSGHTHRVENEERDGVLFLNPGSAGQGRFGHPRTMAKLIVTPTRSLPGSAAEHAAQMPAVPRLDVEILVLS